MKKSPKNLFTGSSVPAILVTLCFAASPAFAADYFHLGVDATFLNAAANYSNTNGSSTPATVSPGVLANSDNFFFYNSTAGIGPLNNTLYTVGTLQLNSLTFGSNVGTTQINVSNSGDYLGGTVITYIGAGGITVDAGAGPVTFGSGSGNTGQRVVVGALADYTVANNSSSDLTFFREFDGRTNETTRVVTVAGSGNGDTIFKDIRSYSSGRNIAMTINKTSGTGVVRFDGANTYTGATDVIAGTLVINGVQTKATGTVTVGSGATLGGSGTLGGALVVDGTHAVGNSLGLQTVVGDATYNSTSIFEWELSSNTTTGRGTDFDAVDVGGALSINSSATFKIILGTDFNDVDAFWQGTQSWDVFHVTGTKTDLFQTFALYNASNLATAVDYSSFGSFTYSYSGNSGALTWSAVPEPTSALAGLLVAAGLLRRRRA